VPQQCHQPFHLSRLHHGPALHWNLLPIGIETILHSSCINRHSFVCSLQSPGGTFLLQFYQGGREGIRQKRNKCSVESVRTVILVREMMQRLMWEPKWEILRKGQGVFHSGERPNKLHVLASHWNF
jgi:hypothetical protein